MTVISPIQYPADKISRWIHDGIIPPFEFDWDFARRGNLDANQGRPAITNTRASDKTYFDNAGVLQTATTNEAGFDHVLVNGVWMPVGPRFEEARTNLFTRSEEADDGDWTKLNCTVVADQGASIDGNTNADEIVDDTSNNLHFWQQKPTVSDNTVYTMTAYIEDVDLGWMQIAIRKKNNSIDRVWFDIANGTVGTVGGGITASVEALPNNIYRFRASLDILAGGATPDFNFATQTADNQNNYVGTEESLYIWGTGLEAGAFPLSYIATTTTAVTRAADIATMAADIGVTRSILLKARTAPGLSSDDQVFLQRDDGTTNNLIQIVRQSDGNIHFVVREAGSESFDRDLGAMADDTPFTVALRAAPGDFAASLDGAIPSSDTGDMPTGIDISRLGHNEAGVEHCNSPIARVAEGVAPLSNSLLQNLAVAA